MTRFVLGATIAATGILLAAGVSVADPSQGEDSKLVLACAAAPTPGVVSPCVAIYDHISSDGTEFVLRQGLAKTGSSVCAAINQAGGSVPATSKAINSVDSQGFSYLESVSIVIWVVRLNCPSSYPQLVAWANTPYEYRGM